MDRGVRATTIWAAVLVVAVAVVARLDLPAALAGAVDILPELLAVPAALLALRLGRHRALAAAALIVALNRVGGPDAPIAVVGAAALALIAAVPELRVTHPGGALHLIGSGVALPLVASSWPVLEALGWPVRLTTAPWPAVIVGACCAATMIVLRWRRTPLDAALPWLILAVAATRLAPMWVSAPPVLVLGAAQLLVVLTLTETERLLAFTDRLTALPNRRALDERLQRLRGSFTIAMVDIDHFKRFNDRWGHAAGDQALRMVATALAKVGGGGRAYRYGGEEFAIVMAGRDARDAADALDAVRAAIAERGFVVRSPARPAKKPSTRAVSRGRRAALTVSIGAASPMALRTSPGEVLKAADRALYRAKHAGRNRLVIG